MKASEIIERFGGRDALADALGQRPKTVEQWMRRNRIPWHWHIPLLRLAEQQGVALEHDELLSTTSRSLERIA